MSNYVFCQITTRRVNFIIDRMDNSAMRDVESKGYNEVEEKDRSWLISLLHQVYSRRLDLILVHSHGRTDLFFMFIILLLTVLLPIFFCL